MSALERCPFFKTAKAKEPLQVPPAVCRQFGYSINLSPRHEPSTPEKCPLFKSGERGRHCDVIKPLEESPAISPPPPPKLYR